MLREGDVQLVRRVRLQVRVGGDEGDHRTNGLLRHERRRDLERLDNRVHVPLLVCRVLFDHGADAFGQLVLELDVTRVQVGEQFFDQDLHIRLIDESVDKLKRTLTDGRVVVLEAVDDRISMPLHRLRVLSHDFMQRVERHVADVVVSVDQKAAKDVDREHSQSALHLDGHNCEHALVQDGVARILCRFSVGGHLCEDVVHLLRRLGVPFAQNAKHAQYFDLEERIDDAVDVVLRLIAGEHEILERGDERGGVPTELCDHFRLDEAHLAHQLQRREQHSVVARAE
mmetsp:Transcript_32652/g.79220  ORF Transcript_32652/g.79220 Transcript_32652/m.79220 type:complete len:285 (-) Transcript_32652:595-1449(-)